MSYYLDVKRTDGSRDRLRLSATEQFAAEEEAEEVLESHRERHPQVGQHGEVFLEQHGGDAWIATFNRPAQ